MQYISSFLIIEIDNNSRKQRKMKNKSISSQALPEIHQQLCKDKRYRYKQHNKQNALKSDLDTIIYKLINHEGPFQNKWHKHISYIKNKVSQSQKKYAIALQYLPKAHQHEQIKAIKTEIAGYLKKMGKLSDRPLQNDYAQFMRLSLQSQDYLEFYLKNRFKSEEDFGIVHSQQKNIILSILKNNYKCLTQNSPSIINRIIMSLNINPLNDFHLINWNIFCKFRRLALLRSSSIEARNFLINYFFIHYEKLPKLEFRLIVKSILGKLQRIISVNNIERWLQRIMAYGDKFLPQQLTRDDLYKIIVKEHFFMWSELLHLIFLV